MAPTTCAPWSLTRTSVGHDNTLCVSFHVSDSHDVCVCVCVCDNRMVRGFWDDTANTCAQPGFAVAAGDLTANLYAPAFSEAAGSLFTGC